MEKGFRFKIMEKSTQNKKMKTDIKNISKQQGKLGRLSRRYFHLTTAIFVALLCFTIIGPDKNFSLEAFDLKGLISSNIPVHPSLIKIKEENFMVNGIKILTIDYKGENTDIPKIIEFYKKVLLQREYKIKKEFSDKGYFGVDFVNGELKIIRIMAYDGSAINKPGYIFVKLFFIEPNLSKMKDYALDQGQDMPGEDISWLKRYPAARRTASSVADNGMATVNYSLDNQSCIQCVVSFYKEEMLASGWLLEKESNESDSENKQRQDAALNLDLIKKRFKETDLPEEKKEKLSEAIERLDSALKESDKSGTDIEFGETTVLNFKKKKEKCAITVSYKKFKPQEERPSWEYLKRVEKKKEDDLKLLADSGEAAKIRQSISRSLGLDIKESVDIGVIYIPSMKSLGGQKAWF